MWDVASRSGRALAVPNAPDIYQQLEESLRFQHPELHGKDIRITGYSVPLNSDWDTSVKPYRRWFGVAYEVTESP